MGKTYEAILTGGQLRWTADAPASDKPVRVAVTVVEPAAEAQGVDGFPAEALMNTTILPRAERGRRMRAALDKLAAADAFADIEDPVEWQRDIRRDRPLPGRSS